MLVLLNIVERDLGVFLVRDLFGSLVVKLYLDYFIFEFWVKRIGEEKLFEDIFLDRDEDLLHPVFTPSLDWVAEDFVVEVYEKYLCQSFIIHLLVFHYFEILGFETTILLVQKFQGCFGLLKSIVSES